MSFGPVFGHFAAGATRIIDYQYSILSWSTGGGVQIPVGPVSACLLYGFQRSVADDLGPSLLPPFELLGIRVTTSTHSGTLALAIRLWSGGRWALVPTATGTLAVFTSDTDSGFLVERMQGGLSGLKIGAGIVFKDRLSVTPAVSWPLYSPGDLEGGLTGSITVSLSLWRR